MLKRILGLAIALMLLLAPTAHANPTGKLFNIAATGPAGTVQITLCLNGLGVLSCQKYTVANLHLSISTVARFHTYPSIGILINTPGYTYARLGVECTIASSGYCIFSASDTAPAPIDLKVSTAPNVQITATPPPVTFVGDSYTQTNVASGGLAPYIYSVVGGALPAGTSLDPNTGTVSGVPTAGGPFSYTIRVTDTNFTTADATTTGVMQGGVVLTSTPSADTEVGVNYSQTNVASGGSAPYTFSLSAGALPAGTNLNTTTGTVSGTPTTAGAFNYTILVTDANGGTASNVISGTIAAAVTIVATPSATTKVAINYSQTNVASNGTTPYTYSLASGALPAGTTLSTTTGTVSGSPTTVQNFTYTIQVTDSVGSTATATTTGSISYNPWAVDPIDPNAILTSVSCPTTTMCMTVDAVGDAFEYSGTTTWLSSPIPAGFAYTSVSCPTTTFCMAVGNEGTNGNAFQFNGSTWQAYVSNPITTGVNILSVSCVSPTFCMAVDADGEVFNWNGTTWTLSTALGVSSRAISCSSTTFCMVVDTLGNANSFNGTTWTAYTNVGATNLNAVSCTPNSNSFCTAVNAEGSAFTFNATNGWNGGTTIDGVNSLNGVSCLGTAFCTAVDGVGNIANYNGNAWSTPADFDGTNSITSVSCPTSSFCVAVDAVGNALIYNAHAADISVANAISAPAVLTFPVTATGNVAASYELTGFTKPMGAFVDLNNSLWVADVTAAKISRFQGSDTGGATPSVSITNTSSTSPSGVVTDATGNIYVVDANNSVFIYPATFQVPGTYPASTASKTIAGAATTLNTPHAIALDASDNIWVANSGANSIVKFTAGTTGGTSNVAPATTITSTALNTPNGIWIDTLGNIWVTNSGNNTIAVFASNASGASTPTCVISSSAITTPAGIALDTQGIIYQANNTTAGAINIFAAVSATCGTTTVTPTATISGAATLLNSVFGLSLGYVF
jgi:sugar lactone lactonase YvrE